LLACSALPLRPGEHPASVATKAFAAAVEAAPVVLADVKAAGAALRAQLTGDTATAGWGMACTNAGAVQAANLAVANLVKVNAGADGADALIDALDTLTAVLGCDEARDTFAGLKLCMSFTVEVWPACAALGAAGAAAAAAVVAAAATKNESCKGAFIKAQVEKPIVTVICDYTDGAALRAACAAVRALTTGDDPREPASGAFTHSRAFAKAGAAPALCAALKNTPTEDDPSLVANLAWALKHTAVNDEICKETAEEGGLHRVLVGLYKLNPVDP
jgi:hypothetical protein